MYLVFVCIAQDLRPKCSHACCNKLSPMIKNKMQKELRDFVLLMAQTLKTECLDITPTSL